MQSTMFKSIHHSISTLACLALAGTLAACGGGGGGGGGGGDGTTTPTPNALTITFDTTTDQTRTYAGASGGKFTNVATATAKGKCTVPPTLSYSAIDTSTDETADTSKITLSDVTPGEVTYKAAGKYTIRASTADTTADTTSDSSVCAAASAQYTLIVNKATADLTFDSSITRRVAVSKEGKERKETYLAILINTTTDQSSTAAMGGSISYSSADTNKASVDATTGEVTAGDKTGDVLIYATYSGSANYRDITGDNRARYTLNISDTVPSITFVEQSPAAKTYAGASPGGRFTNAATVDTNGFCTTTPGVTYSISGGSNNPSVDASGTVTYRAATLEGSPYTITASTTGCAAADATYALTVNKAIPTFTFDNPPTHMAIGASVPVPARLTGVGGDLPTAMGGTISYSSDNTSGASVDANGTVTTGSDATSNVTITASYTSGSDNYTNATASYTFSIVQLAVNGSPIKKLIFTWLDVTDAVYYKLSKVDTTGGMNTQVGQDVTASNTGDAQSITRIVPLYASAGTQYMLESCDRAHECTPSTNNATITQAQLNRAIGYIKASNTGVADLFGASVSLSADGTTLAVGAYQEDSSADGVGNDQSEWSTMDNDNTGYTGAVYVFTRDASDDWTQDAYIKASNTGFEDWFGESLSLSADGTTLAVGAWGEDSDATGVYNNQSQWNTAEVGGNDRALGAGAVYVFTRNATTDNWSQQAYIKASNAGGGDSTTDGDAFGYSLNLNADGTTLAVGAYWEGSDATGVYNNQSEWSSMHNNNGAPDSGAVYVFSRDASDDWTQDAYIKASNADGGDDFGWILGLSADGNTLAVGAIGEGSYATGVDNDEGDGALYSGAVSGAVYVFSRDTSMVWSQQAYIKASNTGWGDAFGWSLSLDASGDTLAVGALGEDSNATGVGNNKAQWDVMNNDHLGLDVNAGAVYVFSRPDTTSHDWSQDAYIKASNAGGGDSTTDGDAFGWSLSLNAAGTTLAVSANWEDSNATGIGGDQSNNSADEAGAVYVFSRTSSTSRDWSQQAYIKASNTDGGDQFGYAVSLDASGDTLAVGANQEKSNATGIGGDQSDNSAPYAGAVYLY